MFWNRKKNGTPWAKLYKKDMKHCAGFDSKKKGSLPCHPSTVVYGHAASRGLDINRWTIGLDSGCVRIHIFSSEIWLAYSWYFQVYNQRMTALVLGGKFAQQLPGTIEDEYDGEAIDIDGNILSSRPKFGDSGRGKIYSVAC